MGSRQLPPRHLGHAVSFPVSLPARLGRLALLPPIVVAGHELVLWVGHGPAATLAASLRSTSHGLGWVLSAAAILLVSAAAILIVAGRIRRLRHRLLTLTSRLPRRGRLEPAELLPCWWWMFGASLAGFLLLENAEHVLTHGHLPLLDPLVHGQYVATVPIFALLTLLTAAATTCVLGRMRTLGTAVQAAERLLLPRAPRSVAVPPARTMDLRASSRTRVGAPSRRAPPTAPDLIFACRAPARR